MRWRTREEAASAVGELLLKVDRGGSEPAYRTWTAVMPEWMEWMEANTSSFRVIAWMPISDIEEAADAALTDGGHD